MNLVTLTSRVALGSALASVAFGQAEPLVVVGDAVPGIGNVTGTTLCSVADGGGWLALVYTDHANPDANDLLMKDGAVYLREGDPIAGGAVTFYGNFSKPRLNAHGDVAFAVRSSGPQPSFLILNGQSVLMTGDPVGAAGFGPGSTYAEFRDVELNDAGRLVVLAEIADPSLADVRDAVLWIDVDAAGTPVAEATVLKEGDAPFGSPLAVPGPIQLAQALAINEAGEVAMQVAVGANSGVMKDQTVLAAYGAASPVFGEQWSSFLPAVDLGDGGDIGYVGRAGVNVVMWNGAVVAKEGDVLPAIAPYQIETIGFPAAADVFVDAGGSIFWASEWSDPDASRDWGLFRDDVLILQEGVSLADGSVLAEVGGQAYALEVTDDGRLLAFDAKLADGRAGTFLLELESDVSPLAGCSGNLASLSLGADPVLGGLLGSVLTGGQSAAAAAFQGFAGYQVVDAAGCGISLFGGELLIGVPFLVLPMTSTVPASAVGTVAIPKSPALLGATVFTQALFADPAAAEPLRLSNAFTVRIGV